MAACMALCATEPTGQRFMKASFTRPSGRRGFSRSRSTGTGSSFMFIFCTKPYFPTHGPRREQLGPGGVRPFGGGDHAGKDVARVTAVAPSHEKIVVVVASQEHSVRQRGELGRRALLRAPDHAAFAVRGKAVGVLARVLRSRVLERHYCDGYRIDKGGLGGALGARVELAGDVYHVIGDQRADFVAVLLLIRVGRHV